MYWGLVDEPWKITHEMLDYIDEHGKVHEDAEDVRPSNADQTVHAKGKIRITFVKR